MFKFKNDSQKIMFIVVATLIPAVAYKIFVFKWLAVFALSTLVITALLTEKLLSKLLGVKYNLKDYTALITALLLFLALNSNMNVFIYFVAAFISIALAKVIYGGFTKNIFNPAIVGWCFVMLSFPQYMTKHINYDENLNIGFKQSAQVFFADKSVDSYTSATPLTQYRKITKYAERGNVLELPKNEPKGLLIINLLTLAGGLVLILTKTITYVMPLFMFTGLAAALLVFKYPFYEAFIVYALYGPFILGAFYIITDPVSSPSLKRSQAIYAFAIGFVALLIAKLGAYPIGVAFSVLLMNSFNYILDNYFAHKKGAKHDN